MLRSEDLAADNDLFQTVFYGLDKQILCSCGLKDEGIPHGGILPEECAHRNFFIRYHELPRAQLGSQLFDRWPVGGSGNYHGNGFALCLGRGMFYQIGSGLFGKMPEALV